MIFEDCGLCPIVDDCFRKGYCQFFDEPDHRCASCKEGREIEFGGMVIHVCEVIPRSSGVMIGGSCPCGCNLPRRAIVEPNK